MIRVEAFCPRCGSNLISPTDNEDELWCSTCRDHVRGSDAIRKTSVSLPRNGSTPAEERIIPPPTSPMAVARLIVDDLYRDIVRHWRGDFYRYAGGIWADAEDRGVREAVYTWLEPCSYLKKDETVPWEPNSRKVNDVLDALKAIVYLDRTVEPPAWLNGGGDIDADGAVVVANGILHVRTRTLVPHSPAFWAHNRLSYEYRDDAPHPSRWHAFLADLWSDDQASIDTLQELFGYFIGSGTEQQKIALLVGPKRSGKGTIARVLRGLLGKDNVKAPTMASLAQNFGLQELIRAPLAIISDARLSSRGDSSVVVERLLSISGEDELTVDRKYIDPWTGRLPTRFLILTNELPRLADSSGALASRFVLLTLTKSFYGEEDPSLTSKLLEEAPGILNWALEGLDRLNQRGYFVMPPSSADVIRQMEDLASPVGAFIRNRCVLGPEYKVTVDDLWAAWKDFAADQNQHPGTKALLGRDLKAAAPSVKRTRPGDGDRVYVYQGIGLQPLGSESPRTVRTEDLEDQPDEPDRPSRPRDSASYSPHENGHQPVMVDADIKQRVDDLAVQFAYPELRISPAETIAVGEESWSKFLRRATEERLESALFALLDMEAAQ